MNLIDECLPTLVKNASLLSKKTILSNKDRNLILKELIEEIRNRSDQIIKVSEEDFEIAKQHTSDESLLNRLKFDKYKIDSCIKGLNQLIDLDDPISQKEFVRELDDGLTLIKQSYPIGVIGVILEARPDAFLQIVGIGIKTNNFLIIKPGMEAQRTCGFLMAIVHQILSRKKLPLEIVTLLHARSQIDQLLKEDQYIDLIIPRGSKKLVDYIQNNTNIPVMGHADGVCHIYVDQIDNVQQTLNMIMDSKVQYPAACNAVETLLIKKSIASEFLPQLVSQLDQSQVSIYADQEVSKIVNREFLTPESWSIEYGDKSINLKIVDDTNEAINHINTYGSHHTDSIITQNSINAETFMRQVDSANVYHNCSTRFADGYRYGFGAEVGISTNKVLPRGPVAIEGLTTYKYHLIGNLHIVDDYIKGFKKFNHSPL
ncbi:MULTISPECIES: glutamate-5-semialdehyde dehydrogenase [Acinetobacter]|uniref:Gamma-glutamyl phosphate reductase n=2 Tax=Acinetobacter parvus TaxID=134533 RepID=N8QEM8_9GAMM|nr:MULTISPECIES: glutamate-5-semialdehyde dehydrogenase [Acinetobacter]ENU37005.1 glutamate-5-semialdehyde dehydrogenase [Acinetobacter parvus DSM 16617 = CIP 108168]ENU84777.1 glutamate-5-semialdehyde dehydrogenase [Acinetobacter sp. CIP 102159]ENU90200.1 glutamate-5-semialdehyde dehydrogenase [Acinetobacter sp. CIP 102529]ENU97165.1 glutamate-5-semialdehyde dehydrogenase [Acinetobacter sp. CIP 102082]